MHLPLTISLLTPLLLLLTLPSPSLTLTLPPLITTTLSQLNSTTIPPPSSSPPITGKPICRRQPGGFTLLLCARLLTNLKTLPDYQKQEIWSEYASGRYRLPVVFVQTDAVTGQRCHLSMDLYEPGVPATASETFSLEGEQRDLNGIYFACLKRYGTAGFARIGLHGNIAALLGPPLEEASEDGGFEGLVGLRNGTGGARVIDLTEFGKS